ncbi:hypothetical protein BJI67_07935 [Acidihalobacter aeolianus]|uniref:Putative DNA-binding domain-containing protein n=1 Tax=Acidihalobacter aeolianus TaxID=2792603 RepID=A0A1D8K7S8_9GAMM|nr:DNA-binding domain-containing protein [Acidihalobacter aeolianus]AOV16996.1 hypothetical protein BJI67_07935 [Acidihalobacter aeolianus]
MSTLSELQGAFAAVLDDPECTAPLEIADGNLSASRRIAIYRNNVRISRRDALAGIYPAVCALVGEAFFEIVAEDYAWQTPSVSGDLRAYGETFPDHLAGQPKLAALSYLPDVARLEWAWHTCFHAAEVTPLGVPDLAVLADAVDPGLALIPAARLLSPRFAAAEIWSFALDLERHPEGLDLDTLEAAPLLVARPGEEVFVLSLGEPDYRWLVLVDQGASLADALDETLALHPDFDFAQSLSQMLAYGVLCVPQTGEDHDPR